MRGLNNAEVVHMFMNQAENSEYNRYTLINTVKLIRIMGLDNNDEDLINYYYDEFDEQTNNRINKEAHNHVHNPIRNRINLRH